jgi:hypothetical protein
MMSKAGLGVAFNAKPKVQEQAQCRINHRSLLDSLYFLGFKKEEIEELVDKSRDLL